MDSANQKKKIPYEQRKQLMEAVHSLPEERLWKVIEVIFGDTGDIDVQGKEFEVNFATLEDALCLQLARYIEFPLNTLSATSAEKATKSEPEKDSTPKQPLKKKPVKTPSAPGESKKRDGSSSKKTSVKRQRTEKNSKKAEMASRLGPRISIRAKQNGTFQTASVMETEEKYALLLFDKDLSLEWVDVNGKGTMCIPLENMVPDPEGKALRMEKLVLPSECQEVLELVTKLDPTEPFREPVEDSRYSQVVKKAMDLGTILDLLSSGAYSGPRQFVNDITLICQNAVTFNPPTHSIHKMAQILISVFQFHWSRLLQKVENSLKLRNFQETVKAWRDQYKASTEKQNVGKRRTSEEILKKRSSKKSGWGTDNESDSDDNDKRTFAQKGREIVGQKMQISWDGPEGPWQKGVIKAFDNKTRRHTVEYEDGTMEKLKLDKEMAILESQTDTCVTLRTGHLVWAKADKHPWWPAEVVVPGISQLKAMLVPPTPDVPLRPSATIMVLYAGESQYDLLRPSSVEAFSFSNQQKIKSRIKKSTDLKSAYDAFLQRCKELGIETEPEKA